MELKIDEAFMLVEEVFLQAIRDARSNNPKIAKPARDWLLIVAPDWNDNQQLKPDRTRVLSAEKVL